MTDKLTIGKIEFGTVTAGRSPLTGNLSSADAKMPIDWKARAEKAEALYHELLYAVESKHPDETRHQTALRYIRHAEAPNGGCGSDSTALTDS